MCNKHPGMTFDRLFGGYICIGCAGLKLTTRCPRCRKGMMVSRSAECSRCGKDAAVFHQGRAYWVEPEKMDLRSEFLWHAKNTAIALGRSDIPGAGMLSHWIYVAFLTEKRPGKATVIGDVNRYRRDRL